MTSRSEGEGVILFVTGGGEGVSTNVTSHLDVDILYGIYPLPAMRSLLVT